MITKIVNGKIILGERVLENYALYFEDDKIMGIFNPAAPAAPAAAKKIAFFERKLIKLIFKRVTN